MTLVHPLAARRLPWEAQLRLDESSGRWPLQTVTAANCQGRLECAVGLLRRMKLASSACPQPAVVQSEGQLRPQWQPCVCAPVLQPLEWDP
jgi:hypothetical protein